MIVAVTFRQGPMVLNRTLDARSMDGQGRTDTGTKWTSSRHSTFAVLFIARFPPPALPRPTLLSADSVEDIPLKACPGGIAEAPPESKLTPTPSCCMPPALESAPAVLLLWFKPS